MQNIDIIQNSLDYIEINLTAELHIEDLAKAAGFSQYHYYRVFEHLVGLPVGQYITHRKLLHAAYAISQGETVITVALQYGFCTSSGFYRAFVREFGCGPQEYVRTHTVQRPYAIKLLQETHIMISQKKLQKVLAHWQLQQAPIFDFYYTGTGQRADNLWRIGQNYVIKVGTNAAGLYRHIQLSRALYSRGFSISLPVSTPDGRDLVEENELYFYLSTILHGQPVNCRDLYLGNNSLARQIGSAIGHLDVALKDLDAEFICNEPDLPELLANRALPAVRAMVPLSDAFCTSFLRTFSLFWSNLPRQPIHRDPNPSNLILQNSNTIGFLDFELSERNIRIFDPCYAATAILSEAFSNPELDRESWFYILHEIFLGYDSTAHLTADEWQAIPYVLFAIELICISFFSSFEKYKALTEVNLAMLQWLLDSQARLILF